MFGEKVKEIIIHYFKQKYNVLIGHLCTYFVGINIGTRTINNEKESTVIMDNNGEPSPTHVSIDVRKQEEDDQDKRQSGDLIRSGKYSYLLLYSLVFGVNFLGALFH